MIVTEYGLKQFPDPEMIKSYPEEQLVLLRAQEKREAFDFWIRENLQTNQEKNTYKVGYLFTFLKLLYPDKNNKEIYQIMDKRYHIFIGERQIQRYVNAYRQLKI